MADEFYTKLQFCSGNAPNYWCVDLRKADQRAVIATIGHYPAPHMAVDAAIERWKEMPVMQEHEWEECCVGWAIEGRQIYAEGLGVEACDNDAREHGWRLAWGSDVQYAGATP